MEKEYEVPEFTRQIHEEIWRILSKFGRKDHPQRNAVMSEDEQERLNALNAQLILAHMKHGHMTSDDALRAKRTIDALK